MSKLDNAIQFMESNMIMLYSISTKDEKEREIPDYILNMLKKHKREACRREEDTK